MIRLRFLFSTLFFLVGLVATGPLVAQHAGPVYAVAWSADGSLIASGGEDKTVRLWDGKSGAAIRVLSGHGALVRSVAFGAGGRRLVSGGYDNTVRIWNVADGAMVAEWKSPKSIRSVAYSADGKWVAAGGEDRVVHILDGNTGVEIRTLEGATKALTAVVFSPDGSAVASTGEDRTIRFHGRADGSLSGTAPGHDICTWALAWSADGKTLASAGQDMAVRLWETETQSSLKTLEGHDEPVLTVALSLDGRHGASSGKDPQIFLWNLSQGKLKRKMSGHQRDVRSLAFSPDGVRLASASMDGSIRIWDVESGLTQVAIGANLKALASVEDVGEETASRKPTAGAAPGKSPAAGSLRVALADFAGAAGNSLAGAARNELMARLQAEGTWTVVDGKGTACESPAAASALGTNKGCPWVIHGRTLAMTSGGKIYLTLKVQDAVNQKELFSQVRSFGNETEMGKAIGILAEAILALPVPSPVPVLAAPAATTRVETKAPTSASTTTTSTTVRTTTTVSTATAPGSVSGTEWTTKDTDGDTYTFRFLPGGILDYTSPSGTYRNGTWKQEGNRVTWEMNGHYADYTATVNGNLISGSAVNRAKKSWTFSGQIKGVSTPKAVSTSVAATGSGARPHVGEVKCLAFSPDGRFLASGSDDKTIRLWNPLTGEGMATYTGHGDLVRALHWNGEGLLVSSSKDGTVRLWNTRTGSAVRSFSGHSGYVRSAAISPDGSRVYSCGDDKTLRVYDAASGETLRTVRDFSEPQNSLVLSPSGDRLAVVGDDKALRVYDTATFRQIFQKASIHGGWIWMVTWSPDGALLATASEDKTVKIWSAEDGSPVSTYNGFTSAVNTVAFSPDGTRIAAGDDEKKVTLWNPRTGALDRVLTGAQKRVWSVAWGAGGKTLAASSEDASVRLYDTGTGTFLRTMGTISAPNASTGGNSIVGTYRAEGKNPNGSTYQMQVRIRRVAEKYLVEWLQSGSVKYSGTGTLIGGTFTVDWGSAQPVIYKVQPDGRLLGLWAGGSASENLTPE